MSGNDDIEIQERHFRFEYPPNGIIVESEAQENGVIVNQKVSTKLSSVKAVSVDTTKKKTKSNIYNL